MAIRCASGSTTPIRCCFHARAGKHGAPAIAVVPHPLAARVLQPHSLRNRFVEIRKEPVVHRPAVAALVEQYPVARLHRTPTLRRGDRPHAFTVLHSIMVAIGEPPCCIDIIGAFSKSHTATETLTRDRHFQRSVRVLSMGARVVTLMREKKGTWMPSHPPRAIAAAPPTPASPARFRTTQSSPRR